MRAITKQAARAFLAGKPYRCKNTEVTIAGASAALLLHGSAIAIRQPCGEITLSLCGYNTPTTRERLNGLCELLFNERPFSQHKFAAYFGAYEIESDAVITIPPASISAGHKSTEIMAATQLLAA